MSRKSASASRPSRAWRGPVRGRCGASCRRPRSACSSTSWPPRARLPLDAAAAARAPSARAGLKRARHTLESLRHQAYPDWQLTIPAVSEADGEALLAALSADNADLAGQVRIAVSGAETRLADLVPRLGRPALLCLLAPGDQLGEDALLELAVAGALEPDGRISSTADERRSIRPTARYKRVLQARLVARPAAVDQLCRPAVGCGRDCCERTGVARGDLAGRRRIRHRAAADGTRPAASCHVAKVLCARGARSLRQRRTRNARRVAARAAAPRGSRATSCPAAVPGSWRVQRAVPGAGMVSIIIPTIASRGLVKVAIESIRAKTACRQLSRSSASTTSRPTTTAEQRRWKAWIARQRRPTSSRSAEPFNWSRFNNIAAAAGARGEFLLFLNDDMEVTGRRTGSTALLEHAQRPEIGVVGPQLLYPDGGCSTPACSWPAGRAATPSASIRGDEPGPFGLALTQRNVITRHRRVHDDAPQRVRGARRLRRGACGHQQRPGFLPARAPRRAAAWSTRPQSA